MKLAILSLVLGLALAGCCYDVGYAADMQECCESNFVDSSALDCQTAFRVGAIDVASQCGLPTFSMGATKYDPHTCAELQSTLSTGSAAFSIIGSSGQPGQPTGQPLPLIRAKVAKVGKSSAPQRPQTPLVFVLAPGSINLLLSNLAKGRPATLPLPSVGVPLSRPPSFPNFSPTPRPRVFRPTTKPSGKGKGPLPLGSITSNPRLPFPTPKPLPKPTPAIIFNNNNIFRPPSPLVFRPLLPALLPPTPAPTNIILRLPVSPFLTTPTPAVINNPTRARISLLPRESLAPTLPSFPPRSLLLPRRLNATPPASPPSSSSTNQSVFSASYPVSTVSAPDACENLGAHKWCNITQSCLPVEDFERICETEGTSSEESSSEEYTELQNRSLTPCPEGYVWNTASSNCTATTYTSVYPQRGSSSVSTCAQFGASFIWCAGTQSCTLVSACNSEGNYQVPPSVSSQEECANLGSSYSWCGTSCKLGPCAAT